MPEARGLKVIAEGDWNIPTAEEDEAVYRQLIRAQESRCGGFGKRLRMTTSSPAVLGDIVNVEFW